MIDATLLVAMVTGLPVVWRRVVQGSSASLGFELEQGAAGILIADLLNASESRAVLPVLFGPANSWDVAGWVVLCSIPLALVTAVTSFVGARTLSHPSGAERALLLASWPAVFGAIASTSWLGAIGTVAVTLLLALGISAATDAAIVGRWVLAAVCVGFLSLAAHSSVRALSVAPVMPTIEPPINEMPKARRWVQDEAVLGATVSLNDVPEVPRPARVILITIDTTRADHLSTYGYGRDTTPRLVALAEQEGVTFERAYASSSWTRPSTASLMTSLSPEQHGVETGRRGIGRKVPTLAAALHADGFRTAAIVANAYAGVSANLHSGFQQFWQTNRFVAGAVTQLAMEWIDEHENEPFFLYLHLIDPHGDYMPPGPFRASFTDPEYSGDLTGRFSEVKPFMRRDRPLPSRELAHIVGLYDGEVAYTDHHLGLFFDRLREADLWQDSLVILVSDHGEEFKDHRSLGHCRTLYDELVRIPMIVKLPGGRPESFRARVSEIARIVDVAPTILQLTGSPMPTAFRGESLIEMMRAPAEPRDAYVRTRGCDGRLPLKEGVVHGHYKLIVNRNGSEELYDLRVDPKETQNLVDDEPLVLRSLRARLDAARTSDGGDESVAKRMTDMDRAQLRALGYISP